MSKSEQQGLAGFWGELERRRVIRVIVLYAIAGWVVIEVFSTVLPNLNLPDWSVTWLEHDNTLANLREQPRFQALLKRLD